MTITTRSVPTKDEVLGYLSERRNWGRWGDKGSAGAMNLIDEQKRLQAIGLVEKGRTVSLSRPFPVTPTAENPRPAQQYVQVWERPGNSGAAVDYYGLIYHGTATTHIDALCHVWDENGMWDGRKPEDTLTFQGANYGTVDAWSDGILTRGVLLDVPKHRGKPYVTVEEPVHGWELEDIVREQGVTLEPGDAVMVYSGREAFSADNEGIWANSVSGEPRPGSARILPAFRARLRHGAARLGHDGRLAQRIRHRLERTRRHLRVWGGAAGQCAA